MISISGKAGLSGQVSMTPAEVVPAGYDIFLGAGQSNKFFGASLDGGLDVSDSRIYQIYNGGLGTAGTLSSAAANDPLDHPDTSGQPNYIGHDVHFAKDYYIANGLLLSPRKLIIVPYAYGGSAIVTQSQWGANTGPLTACTTNAGSLIETAISRVNSALGQSGSNAVKAVLWHQGEGDYEAYGNVLKITELTKFRWRMLRTLLYLRQHIDTNVPIVVGRLSQYSIDAGGSNYAGNGVLWDQIIRATVNRLKYTGVADSQSPSALGPSDIHFTAAEQRTFAGRYWTAYQASLTNTLNSPTTWDATDYPQSSQGHPAGFTLSNGNLDASGDANSGWKTIWATNPRTTGKLYAELKVIAVNNNTNIGFVGFCNSDHALDNYLGHDGPDGEDGPAAKSAGQWTSLASSVRGYTQVWSGTLGNYSVNDIVMIALDIPAGKAWIGKNNVWGNSGDPAAGTNPWVTGLVDGEMHFLACSIYTGMGNTMRLLPAAASQTYTAPSGFSAWD